VDVEETREGEVVILLPHGKLDAKVEAAFERKLKELLEAQERYLVVDFAKVDYVSGGSLRTLLLISRRLAPRGGRLVLCRLSEVVHQAFTIAGFDRVFVMAATRAEAIEQAGPPREQTPAADDRVAQIAAFLMPLLADPEAPAFAAAEALPAGLAETLTRLLAEAAG
jgi:anti-anti-sigma factor